MSVLIVGSLNWLWPPLGLIAGPLWDFGHTTVFMAVLGHTLATWSSLLLTVFPWYGAPSWIYSNVCLSPLSFLLTWNPGLAMVCYFPGLPKLKKSLWLWLSKLTGKPWHRQRKILPFLHALSSGGKEGCGKASLLNLLFVDSDDLSLKMSAALTSLAVWALSNVFITSLPLFTHCDIKKNI